MKEILINIGFDLEDIDFLLEKLQTFGKYKVEKIVNLLTRYGCSKIFIKEIIINKNYIFSYDVDQLEYKLEAIVSNGELVEEVILDII